MLCVAQGKEPLNRMSYITAVTKEVLRLHPQSGTARYMPSGSGTNVQLADDGEGVGRTICLAGTIVYNCPIFIHRDETIYSANKDDSVSERWLDNPVRLRSRLAASSRLSAGRAIASGRNRPCSRPK